MRLNIINDVHLKKINFLIDAYTERQKRPIFFTKLEEKRNDYKLMT